MKQFNRNQKTRLTRATSVLIFSTLAYPVERSSFKTVVWLALVLIGIAVAIAGAALFAYQEYRLVGNYGAYSISVPVNPYQGAGEALIIGGSLMAVLMLLYMIYIRRNAIGTQPPPPPPPPPEA